MCALTNSEIRCFWCLAFLEVGLSDVVYLLADKQPLSKEDQKSSFSHINNRKDWSIKYSELSLSWKIV